MHQNQPGPRTKQYNSMNILSLLSQERTRAHIKASSKKKALQYLSEVLSQSLPTLSANLILDHLIARERLGSTGLGTGVALPHSRLTHIEEPIGVLITLTQPIDFDSPDNRPVDIIFCLVVPDTKDGEHLELLSQLANLFTTNNIRNQIRTADNPVDILNLIYHWQQHVTA